MRPDDVHTRVFAEVEGKAPHLGYEIIEVIGPHKGPKADISGACNGYG